VPDPSVSDFVQLAVAVRFIVLSSKLHAWASTRGKA